MDNLLEAQAEQIEKLSKELKDWRLLAALFLQSQGGSIHVDNYLIASLDLSQWALKKETLLSQPVVKYSLVKLSTHSKNE